MWIKDMMINGSSIGQAFSKNVWIYDRDFTAKYVDMEKYNIALYGSSTMQAAGLQVIYGDPTLTVYSPEWTEPVPVLP
jgi:ferritin-like metal-binding protein YciE